MTFLSQEEFEMLLGRGVMPENMIIPSFSIIYFTATWCGACKRLDLPRIMNTAPSAKWYKCDVDMNNYTAGFCGIRSIPAFLVVKNKKILGMLGDSRTEKVVEWLKSFV